MLNQAKIIVDVAHAGNKTALDTIAASEKVVVCSHGNSRAVINSPRNFPDEVLKAVGQKGGVVGVVGYPDFVSTKKRPTMDDMIRMTDHIVELVGIDHVGVGMDTTPTMADYVGNIDYLVQLVGIDHVAIASDYTNQISMTEAQQKAAYKVMIDSGAWDKKTYPYDVLIYPQGVETPKTLFNRTDALLARGYRKEDVAKLWAATGCA